MNAQTPISKKKVMQARKKRRQLIEQLELVLERSDFSLKYKIEDLIDELSKTRDAAPTVEDVGQGFDILSALTELRKLQDEDLRVLARFENPIKLYIFKQNFHNIWKADRKREEVCYSLEEELDPHAIPVFSEHLLISEQKQLSLKQIQEAVSTVIARLDLRPIISSNILQKQEKTLAPSAQLLDAGKVREEVFPEKWYDACIDFWNQFIIDATFEEAITLASLLKRDTYHEAVLILQIIGFMIDIGILIPQNDNTFKLNAILQNKDLSIPKSVLETPSTFISWLKQKITPILQQPIPGEEDDIEPTTNLILGLSRSKWDAIQRQ